MSLSRLNLSALTVCWLAIVICDVSPIAAGDRLQQPAGVTDQVVDEAKLRGALSDAVRQNLELRGSWAKVFIEEDKSLRVVLVVDSENSVGTRQEKMLRELVRQYAGPKFDNFGPTEKLSVGALLMQIVTETEDDPLLAGVRVLDAYFYPRDGLQDHLYLKLNGSISNVDQAEVLRKLCNEKWVPAVMGEAAASSVIVDTDPATGSGEADVGMVVRPLSAGAASMCFETGMESFVLRDYHKSLTYLTCASQDDPSRAEIKYWRVAALIALGQKERAREIVRKLTPPDRVRVPYFTSRVLNSLERINGPIRTPIRQQLHAMVREVICGQ